MKKALYLAQQAAKLNEIPVGAIAIDKAGRILATEHNRSIISCDPTAHAEILALRSAATIIGNYRLTEITLYISLEPCPMCIGAIIWARIKRVVFGAYDLKSVSLTSKIDLFMQSKINHRPSFQGGILENESSNIIKNFFLNRHYKNNKIIK